MSYNENRNATTTTTDYTYLIDGIEVSPSIYERRRIFGEHPSARFECIPRRKSERDLRRARLGEQRLDKRDSKDDDKGEIWHTLKPSLMKEIDHSNERRHQ